MSIIDKLKEDFRPKLADLKKFKHTHADGEETVVYFRSVANAVQTDKYLPLLSENKIEGYAELVLQRALNADGSRMFKPKDKPVMMKDVDPEFLTDVGNAILGVDSEGEANKEVAEIEKK
jgi:hypothetical protein